MHRDPDQPVYDYKNYMHNKVVLAQYDLTKYLANNLGVPVVSESLSIDSDCNVFSDICNYTQKFIFPTGLPISFEQLTAEQKAMLYQRGADFALMFMGILPKVYKSLNKKDSVKIHERLKDLPGQEYVNAVGSMDSMRENLALDNVKRVSNDGNKVFIIFGRDHDFREECNERGFKLMEISYEDHYNNIKYVNQNLATMFMEACRYVPTALASAWKDKPIWKDKAMLVTEEVTNDLSKLNNDKTTITIITKGLCQGQALKTLASVWADKTALVAKNDNSNLITVLESIFINVGNVVKFTIPNNSQQYNINMLKIIDSMNVFPDFGTFLA